MVDISLSWWEAWYMLLIYLDLTSLLCILVADISLNWVMAGGDSSAGRTGLGSAVLDGIVIGVGLPVGSPLLSRHLLLLLICLDLASTLPWHSGWHTLLCLDMVGISLTWRGAWYMLPIYLDLAYPLYILVADISLSWIMADGDSSAGWTGLGSAVLDGVIIGVGLPVGTFLHICMVTNLTPIGESSLPWGHCISSSVL